MLEMVMDMLCRQQPMLIRAHYEQHPAAYIPLATRLLECRLNLQIIVAQLRIP